MTVTSDKTIYEVADFLLRYLANCAEVKIFISGYQMAYPLSIGIPNIQVDYGHVEGRAVPWDIIMNCVRSLLLSKNVRKTFPYYDTYLRNKSCVPESWHFCEIHVM